MYVMNTILSEDSRASILPVNIVHGAATASSAMNDAEAVHRDNTRCRSFLFHIPLSNETVYAQHAIAVVCIGPGPLLLNKD